MAKTSFEPVTFEVVTWSFLMFQKWVLRPQPQKMQNETSLSKHHLKTSLENLNIETLFTHVLTLTTLGINMV